MGFDGVNDSEIRAAAFEFLDMQRQLFEGRIPYRVLLRDFRFRNTHIPLLSPQGIFKPAILDLPLTIRTAYQGPYEDRLGPDGLLRASRLPRSDTGRPSRFPASS